VDACPPTSRFPPAEHHAPTPAHRGKPDQDLP
jgi:hypothetical protein